MAACLEAYEAVRVSKTRLLHLRRCGQPPLCLYAFRRRWRLIHHRRRLTRRGGWSFREGWWDFRHRRRSFRDRWRNRNFPRRRWCHRRGRLFRYRRRRLLRRGLLRRRLLRRGLLGRRLRRRLLGGSVLRGWLLRCGCRLLARPVGRRCLARPLRWRLPRRLRRRLVCGWGDASGGGGRRRLRPWRGRGTG